MRIRRTVAIVAAAVVAAVGLALAPGGEHSAEVGPGVVVGTESAPSDAGGLPGDLAEGEAVELPRVAGPSAGAAGAEAASPRTVPSAAPEDEAAPEDDTTSGEVTPSGDGAAQHAPAEESAEAAAPAEPAPSTPEGVCAWDDGAWECEDDGGDDDSGDHDSGDDDADDGDDDDDGSDEDD